MDINALSPYLRVAKHSVMKAPFKINRRILYDYELILLEKGSWRLTVDNKEYRCNPHDVLLLCPGQPHSIESVGDISVSQPHIHFDLCYDTFSREIPVSFKDLPAFSNAEKKLIRENLFENCPPPSPFLKFHDFSGFQELFFSVIETVEAKKSFYQIESKANMILLLKYIFEENFPGILRDDPPLISPAVPIRDYLDHNFYNRITLENLAMQFHYNKYYIEKEFCHVFGVPTIRYYHSLRIDAAKKWLNENRSVTEIAERLNFSSIYAFSRFFKEKTGLSPTEYRKFHSSD